jgi:hypothetical protein
MKYIFFILFAVISCSAFGQRPVPVKTYIQALQDKYASGMFKSDDDAVVIVTMDDPALSGSLNIFQYLQGRVAGLQISRASSPSPIVKYRSMTPAIYLDEMRVDANTISSVNVHDIAYVKVFRNFIAAAGGNSAIAIYTRIGDEGEEEEEDGQ